MGEREREQVKGARKDGRWQQWPNRGPSGRSRSVRDVAYAEPCPAVRERLALHGTVRRVGLPVGGRVRHRGVLGGGPADVGRNRLRAGLRLFVLLLECARADVPELPEGECGGDGRGWVSCTLIFYTGFCLFFVSKFARFNDEIMCYWQLLLLLLLL